MNAASTSGWAGSGDRLQTHAVLKRSFGSTWGPAALNGAGAGWSPNGGAGGWSAGASLSDLSGGGGGALDTWNG